MKTKPKIGDKVYIHSKLLGEFFHDTLYTVIKVNEFNDVITVKDDTDFDHTLSPCNYSIITGKMANNHDIISATDLIGKKVKDGRSIHTIIRISIYIKGVNDREATQVLSTVSHTKLNKLKNGEILIVLHDNNSNFPYENHVEMNQIDVKLNDKYIATVTKDSIVVGCQTFSPSILKELSEAYAKVQ